MTPLIIASRAQRGVAIHFSRRSTETDCFTDLAMTKANA
jgi:hypothetical protein